MRGLCLTILNHLKSLIDSEKFIKKNLLFALKHYDDRVKFVGPDCGLKGWNPPQVAYELLRRTYKVIKDVKNAI